MCILNLKLCLQALLLGVTLLVVGVAAEAEDGAEDQDGAELLQAAENGRYKVVAKAEPYKNLPVGLGKIREKSRIFNPFNKIGVPGPP